MRQWRLCLGAAAGGIVLLVGPSTASPVAPRQEGWAVTDLGTSGEAFAINGRGQIVGSTESPGKQRAFLWRDGRLTMLPGSVATAINERGDVVGYPYVGTQQAFMWQNGAAIRLQTLGGHCPSSMPYAINNHGWVVGWRGDQDDCSLRMSMAWEAALWRKGTMTNLGPQSEAVAINDRGTDRCERRKPGPVSLEGREGDSPRLPPRLFGIQLRGCDQ